MDNVGKLTLGDALIEPEDAVNVVVDGPIQDLPELPVGDVLRVTLCPYFLSAFAAHGSFPAVEDVSLGRARVALLYQDLLYNILDVLDGGDFVSGARPVQDSYHFIGETLCRLPVTPADGDGGPVDRVDDPFPVEGHDSSGALYNVRQTLGHRLPPTRGGFARSSSFILS